VVVVVVSGTMVVVSGTVVVVSGKVVVAVVSILVEVVGTVCAYACGRSMLHKRKILVNKRIAFEDTTKPPF
jgi:hypothetical protein